MEEEKIIETKEEDFKKEEEVKEESYLYRLEEMKDEMEKSLANMEEVISKQNHLADTLSKLNDPAFDELVEGIKNQNKNFDEQILKLNERKKHLMFCIELGKEDKSYEDIINHLILAFGIFNN